MGGIGLLGGTFDPIHYAHLYMGELVAEELALDRVIYLPNGAPPHKSQVRTPARVRLEMTRVAVADNPRFEVSDYEIAQAQPCYSVDTVAHFCECYRGEKIIFILGEDSLAYVDEWKDAPRLLQSCEFAAVGRGGFHSDMKQKIAQLNRDYGTVIHGIQAPELDLSSELIRQRLRSGKSVRYLMPQELIDFIEKNHIYR